MKSGQDFLFFPDDKFSFFNNDFSAGGVEEDTVVEPSAALLGNFRKKRDHIGDGLRFFAQSEIFAAAAVDDKFSGGVGPSGAQRAFAFAPERYGKDRFFIGLQVDHAAAAQRAP